VANEQEQSIDRAFFREDEAGNTVFFPWGLPHRGYELPDDTARKKASRSASFLIGSTIAIGVWTAHALQPIVESEGLGAVEILRLLAGPAVALMLVILLYAWRVARLVESVPESRLRVSREERMREAADLVAPWKIAAIGVGLVAMSALVIWLEARLWWLGLLGIACGIGLTVWSILLKRAAGDAAGGGAGS
jgi:hypothetical protein